MDVRKRKEDGPLDIEDREKRTGRGHVGSPRTIHDGGGPTEGIKGLWG